MPANNQTKGPFTFALTNDNSHTVIIHSEMTDDASRKLGGYAFNGAFCVHAFQAPVLAASDTFSVYGKGIGGGWALIGQLADAADSEGFIEAKGGWWTSFKVVGTSLTGTVNCFMVSRAPDLATGVNPRSV